MSQLSAKLSNFGIGLDVVLKNYCIFTYLKHNLHTVIEKFPTSTIKIITEINVEHPSGLQLQTRFLVRLWFPHVT